jgi:predicted molibdopterin-dependent oxidoreductase YjgC
VLYVVPREGADLPADLLGRAKKKVLFSLTEREGDVVFPLTTWIEKDGTVVSAGDRVQRLAKGITFEPTLLTERVVLERLRAAFEPGAKAPDSAARAFARICEEHPAFGGLSWARVGLGGAPLRPAEATA